MKWIFATYYLLITVFTFSQCSLFGNVRNEIDTSLPFVKLRLTSSVDTFNTYSDEFGRFAFEHIPSGNYTLYGKYINHEALHVPILLQNGTNQYTLTLQDTSTLSTVDIYYESPYNTRMMRMVDGVTLTNGKKTQQIDIAKIDANHSVNNARELYAKVPGLTIWESDAGGLQLGIGARGLSPSRTAHFNTRQNGYDISADALGYPETYYTPPSEALQTIQLIRGAASLQFGPQFGGMINFKLKEPAKKPICYEGAHTYGAYNLINTFNLVSGTLGKRFSYLGYFQHKQGNGWRENSGFNQQTGFLKLKYRFNERVFLSLEQTYMGYLAQQAGGLTDQLFEKDPRKSIRDRNWFKVNWKITAAHFNWEVGRNFTVDVKGFSVDAERLSLGNLEKISRIDDGKERTLIRGDFKNIGGELRLLKKYPIGKKMLGIAALGGRYYQGSTISQQGLGSANSDADFTYLNPTNLEGSDYTFPSQNIAAFIENILKINKKLSFSAGVRYEYIDTKAEGRYREQVFHPLTGLLLFDSTYTEKKGRTRGIVLGGVGFSYRKDKGTEIYGNIAQNYRGINFSDIRIVNPNQIVDPEIKDEKGFNMDLGIRGKRKKGLFDFSAFFMYYDNKIGVINEKINDYEFIRLRTNVGMAYSTGIELFAEHNFKKTDTTTCFFSVFGNLSAVYARYGKYKESALSQNWIELVPPFSGKVGIKFSHGKWKHALLTSYVHRHFSDGTNAESDPSAIAGVIPSYYVMDVSSSFSISKIFKLKMGINNLTNNAYFTRRATAYPGPGIIPSDGISGYITLGIKL